MAKARAKTVGVDAMLNGILTRDDFSIHHSSRRMYEHSALFRRELVPDHIIWYVLRGRFVGSIDGEAMVIEPGMIQWREPGC